MYLKSEKGAPLRQSLPVKAIIGSTPEGIVCWKTGWSLTESGLSVRSAIILTKTKKKHLMRKNDYSTA